MLPETKVNMPKVNTIIAEEPAARPSIPSVKLAPLETAVTIKITTGININQAYFSNPSPAHEIKSE